VVYTGIATFGKFALGCYLALLLNNHFPFKSILRAIILLPWIVPAVLGTLAWRRRANLHVVTRAVATRRSQTSEFVAVRTSAHCGWIGARSRSLSA